MGKPIDRDHIRVNTCFSDSGACSRACGINRRPPPTLRSSWCPSTCITLDMLMTISHEEETGCEREYLYRGFGRQYCQINTFHLIFDFYTCNWYHKRAKRLLGFFQTSLRFRQ